MRSSNPNDHVEKCPECGKKTLYYIERDTEILVECDCGYRLVLKYKRGTMAIPKGLKSLEEFNANQL